MKKLFLSFAVLAGLSVISCGHKAENCDNAECADTTATEVVEEAAVAVDTTANDTVVAVVEEAAEAPVAE